MAAQSPLVIELSSSDHSWAAEYDDAGFATVVRDDDAPDNQQAHHVIDLMEVWVVSITCLRVSKN